MVFVDCTCLWNEKKTHKKPRCWQMDCVCGHESLMRPAWVHIYSTTIRLKKTTTCKSKHYFPVNQQLCCLACSFHDIFSKNQKTLRKTNPPLPAERSSLAYRAAWMMIMFLFGFPHTPLWSSFLAVRLIQLPKHVKLWGVRMKSV